MIRLKIDDPLDAVAVHLGGGFWGVLSVPIFNKDSGIFYDGSSHSFRLFGWNLLGVLVIMAWSAALSLILFVVLRVTKQLRVSAEIEEKGLDIPKHGEPAYPLASYGDGWSESPSAPRQTLPFSHSNGVTPVQSNYPEKGGGIDNPSLEVIEAPNKNETTEF